MKKGQTYSIIMIAVLLAFSLALAGPAPMMDKPSQAASFVQGENGAMFEFTGETVFQAVQPSFYDLECTCEEGQWPTNHTDIWTGAAIAVCIEGVSGGDYQNIGLCPNQATPQSIMHERIERVSRAESEKPT